MTDDRRQKTVRQRPVGQRTAGQGARGSFRVPQSGTRNLVLRLLAPLEVTLLLVTGHGSLVTPAFAATLLVDDFEGGDIKNRLGNRANVFIRAPSKAMVSLREDVIEGEKSHVLLLRYDKKNSGGPYDSGGWCGYYTLLKSPGALVAPTPENPNPPPLEEQYLDGTAFKAVTFWVRGEKGDENFVVGLADRHWDRVGDSVKSQEISKYVPQGKLTTQWQRAHIPLDEFFLDYTKLSSIAIVFEGELFPESGHAGTVYIDKIALE